MLAGGLSPPVSETDENRPQLSPMGQMTCPLVLVWRGGLPDFANVYLDLYDNVNKLLQE